MPVNKRNGQTTDEHDWMLAWVSMIHAATHLRAELDRRLRAELEISLAEQDLLKQLAASDDSLTLTALALRIYFSKAGMTKMIDRLESQGLLRREPVAGDRRARRAALTRRGRATLERSWKLLRAHVEENFRRHLTHEEVAALGSALRSLLEGLGRWEGQMAHLRGEAPDDG